MQFKRFAIVGVLAIIGCSMQKHATNPSEPNTAVGLVSGIASYACQKHGPTVPPPETHRCYFVPTDDFSTTQLRAAFAVRALSPTCKSVEVLSDQQFTSSDTPPQQLRRVGVRCVK